MECILCSQVAIFARDLLRLQNAMTSSRKQRMSAEVEGYRIERSLMNCAAPPSKGGRRNPSVSSSRFLVAKGVCMFRPALPHLGSLIRLMLGSRKYLGRKARVKPSRAARTTSVASVSGALGTLPGRAVLHLVRVHDPCELGCKAIR